MKTDSQRISDILQGLGISPTEATTYLALLDVAPLSIRKVAAATGINRGTTYEALKRLTALGLASVHRQGNREHYIAESPEKILEIIRDKRRDLLDIAAVAKEVVPGIVARKVHADGQPLVRYYQDDEGIVTILKDVLQTCRMLGQREYCAYSSSAVRQYLYRKFPNFTKQRISEAIHVNVIAVGEGGESADYAARKWIIDPGSSHPSSYTIIYG